MSSDYREFLKLLSCHKVKYVIVGAHAVVAHSRPRATGDLDILIEISKEKSNLTIITINQLTLELKQYLKLLIERVNKIKGDDFVFKVISKYAYQKEKRKNIVLNMLDKKFWGYLAQENNVLIEIIMGLVEKERIA